MVDELTLFAERARAQIGEERVYAEPLLVEKGAIRRYAEAVLDANPLHTDEAYARSRGFSGVVAPALFLCGFPPQELFPPIPEGLTGLHGGDEWEFLGTVQSGDVITRAGKLTDVTERVGRTGRMVFLTMEIRFTNQRGDLVAKYRPTAILRPKPEAM